MLRQAKQSRYFQKHWKALTKNLSLSMTSQGKEALHDFRVEFKKIKAFVQLNGTADLRKALEAAKPVYWHSGRVRDLQVQLALLKKYRAGKHAFYKHLEDRLKREMASFRRHRKAYELLIQDTGKALLTHLNDLKNKHVLHCVKKQGRKVSDLLTHPLKDDALHDSRRHVKFLLYTPELLPKSLLKKCRLNLPFLQDLQETIGSWHDAVLATDLLEKHIRSGKQLAAPLRKRSTILHHRIESLSKHLDQKLWA